MGARHRGREIALQILYQVDVSGLPTNTALEVFKKNFTVKKSPGHLPKTWQLVFLRITVK